MVCYCVKANQQGTRSGWPSFCLYKMCANCLVCQPGCVAATHQQGHLLSMPRSSLMTTKTQTPHRNITAHYVSCHSIWRSLTFYVTFCLTFTSRMTFYACAILHDILYHIYSHLRASSAHWNLELAVEIRQCPLKSGARSWGPAVHTEIWSLRLRSGSAHCDPELVAEVRQWSGARGWGPALISSLRLRFGRAHCDPELVAEVRQCAVRSGGGLPLLPTEIWSLQLRSGSAHCDLELAVEVWPCPIQSGACCWGSAAPTEIWSSQLRSGSAHCDPELAVEVWQCSQRSGARSWGPDGRKEGRGDGGSKSDKI